MNYGQVVTTLQTMLEIPLNDEDANFTRILPTMFNYAEGRIYRELDFLPMLVTQIGKLTARQRSMALPPTVLVLRQINVCTPASLTVSDSSERHTLERISPEALDMFWPQSSFRPALPQKFALLGDTPMATALTPSPFTQTPPPPPSRPQVFSYLLRFMPTPDQAYPVEFLGSVRPNPLSPTNPETYLSVNYPDLLICACMVFGAGYQRDFGAQADDPSKAMSWEAQYNSLRLGIMLEVARQRGEGPGWTAQMPAPLAAQPRAP